jgi:hypothetical protein
MDDCPLKVQAYSSGARGLVFARLKLAPACQISGPRPIMARSRLGTVRLVSNTTAVVDALYDSLLGRLR